MASLKGFCAGCSCWFPIRDASLRANHLCPRCLRPAGKVRHSFKTLAEPRFTNRASIWRRRLNEGTGSAES